MLFLYFAQGNPCAIENSYNAEMHDYKICIEEKEFSNYDQDILK